MNLRDSPKPPLLALLGDSRLRERIRAALHLGASSQVIDRVIFSTDWRQLDDLAARHPGSPAFVDTFCESPQPSTWESVGMSGGPQPTLPVICYTRLDRPGRRQLSKTGISLQAYLIPGVNDHFEALDAAILRSIDAHRVDLLRERVKGAAHRGGFEVFDCALDLAVGPCTVPDIAACVGLTKRTLERRCAVFGIPSPKRLFSLARIFTVQRLAEWSHQPFGAVARALGFSDRSNYRRMVRRLIGCAPSAVDQLGGSDYVARVILNRLGQYRVPGASTGTRSHAARGNSPPFPGRSTFR